MNRPRHDRADLKRIAADVGDPSLRVVADVGEEGALYVSGAYEDAHLICRRILDERRPGLLFLARGVGRQPGEPDGIVSSASQPNSVV